ncbi:MAG: hypothetical protein OXF98_12270 [Rhodospirillaceae bacterium]|nr:hypothetical protein [Rhodospirillaceae bacterium]
MRRAARGVVTPPRRCAPLAGGHRSHAHCDPNGALATDGTVVQFERANPHVDLRTVQY